MKTFALAALALAMTAGPWCAPARAEDGGKDKDRGRGEFSARMKERLGLTDDQAAKLKSVWEAERAAIKPLREQAREDRRKLEEQVRGLASDKDIQATLDRIDANRKAMADEHRKAEASLASTLKPYQRAKLRLAFARMRRAHKGGERRRGRRHEHRLRHDDGGRRDD